MTKRFCIATLIPFIFVASALSAQVITVDQSDADLIDFTIIVPDVSWDEVDYRESVKLYTPKIKGFTNGSLFGSPALPVFGSWIVVPIGKKAVLVEKSTSTVSLDRHKITPEPTPVMRIDGDGEHSLGQELILPGDIAKSGEVIDINQKALLSKDAVVLGSPVKWRGRTVQSLTISPIKCSEDGYAQSVIETANYQIKFIDGEKKSSEYATSNDINFASYFLNPEQLKYGKKGHSAVKPRNRQLLAPEIRLSVSRTRLQKVTATDLINYGLLTQTGVLEDQVRLYQRRYNDSSSELYDEIEVPILMVGNDDEFSEDDYFVFYGLRLRDDPDAGDPNETWAPSNLDPVNNGNIYYLSIEEPNDSWARINIETTDITSGPFLDSYRRTDISHEDNAYAVRPLNSQIDRNRWNGSKDEDVTVSIPVYNPVTNSGSFNLSVELFSFSSTTRNMEIFFGNGTDADPIATVVVSQDSTWFRQELPAAQLAQSGLRLKVNRENNSLISAYLNQFIIEYDAYFEATSNRLEFNSGSEVGSVPIQVSGFLSEDIHLFNITDKHNPVVIEIPPDSITEDDGGWKFSFVADGSSTYYAIGGSPSSFVYDVAYNKASVISEPYDISEMPDNIDLFVITHPDFKDSLEPWIQHRMAMSADSLTIEVVDVHSIYDLFSGGNKNPDAIHKATQYAKSRGAWALQIVGDANENVRSLGDTSYRDWVPSHWHCWYSGSYPNEMLPSDKWFSVSNPTADYPEEPTAPAEMLTGRFPCNSSEELSVMIGKIIEYETASPNDDWKKRAVFLADDAWSSGYNKQRVDTEYQASEFVFELEERYAAEQWSYIAGGKLDSVGIFLDDTLGPLVPEGDTIRSGSEFQDHAYDYIWSSLISKLSNGSSLFRYQGHANDYLLAHEHIIKDQASGSRQDVSYMSNSGKPWIFLGFGCHICTWSKDSAELLTGIPSLGEKMLSSTTGGASAVYASSGYEFVTPNANFSRFISDIWSNRPPRGGIAPQGRSRWIIGELLLSAESELIAHFPNYSNYQRLIAQHCLLGDALMTIDCGSPELLVNYNGVQLVDGDTPEGIDSSTITLDLVAVDEAGIDRIKLIDSLGNDLSSLLVDTTPEVIDFDSILGTDTGHTINREQSDQLHTWQVSAPVNPFDHELIFHVYDTADAADDFEHTIVTLQFPVAPNLTLDGEPFDPVDFSFPANSLLSFSGSVEYTSWLDNEANPTIVGQNLVVTNAEAQLIDSHTINLSFDAELPTVTAAQDRAVILAVNGFETELIIEYADVPPVESSISDLSAFPNPVADSVRFLFNTNVLPVDGRIRIWSVGADEVAVVDINSSMNSDGYVVVPWDCRDNSGDDLANGVYLYRVELDNGLSSEVQKLVVMH